MQDLLASGELPDQHKQHSIYGPSSVGGFKFCFIHKSVPSKGEALSGFDEWVLRTKYTVRRLAGSKSTWYGLDTSSLIRESVPLIITPAGSQARIQRQAAPAAPGDDHPQ